MGDTSMVIFKKAHILGHIQAHIPLREKNTILFTGSNCFLQIIKLKNLYTILYTIYSYIFYILFIYFYILYINSLS